MKNPFERAAKPKKQEEDLSIDIDVSDLESKVDPAMTDEGIRQGKAAGIRIVPEADIARETPEQGERWPEAEEAMDWYLQGNDAAKRLYDGNPAVRARFKQRAIGIVEKHKNAKQVLNWWELQDDDKNRAALLADLQKASIETLKEYEEEDRRRMGRAA